MPSSQRMFVTNAKAQEIASQFLQQYFLIFDSENRQPLLDAYAEHACFSMTVSYSQNSNKYVSNEYSLLLCSMPFLINKLFQIQWILTRKQKLVQNK